MNRLSLSAPAMNSPGVSEYGLILWFYLYCLRPPLRRAWRLAWCRPHWEFLERVCPLCSTARREHRRSSTSSARQNGRHSAAATGTSEAGRSGRGIL